MVGGPSMGDRAAMIDTDPGTSGTFQLIGPHLLRPDGNGFYQAWADTPASSGFFSWNEEIPNGDTNYQAATANTQRETSTFEDAPTDGASGITGVRVTVVAKRTAGDDQVRVFIRLNSVNSADSASLFPASGQTTYGTFSAIISTRPGGGSWTWDDINALEAGVVSFMVGTTFSAVRVTQLYIEVLGPIAGYFEFNTFNVPGMPQFNPGWVDFKVKWSSPATVDDQYRIVYRVDPDTTWNVLRDWNPTGADAEATVGVETLARTFAMKAEPNNATWEWTDISNIKVRFETSQVATSDATSISMYEVWVQVAPNPPPPSASTAISVQPSIIGLKAGQSFFVDIYVRGLTLPGLGVYTMTLYYDPAVLTATEFWTYAPMVNMLPSAIDDTVGSVGISAYTFLGDTVGYTEPDFPIARIYFTVDADGTSLLDLTFGELKQVGIDPIYPPLYDGTFRSPHIMSLTTGLMPPPPNNPIGTTWHELYPTYSTTWLLSSWVDNGDGYLSPSDQIDMNEPGWLVWFHVDQVTVTIHFTFKDPDTGTGEAEPETPMTEIPPATSPIDSRWHMVYPTYSRMFTITSWTDQDGGGNFDPSDQFDFRFDDQPVEEPDHWAHLDSVSTDIWVTEKSREPSGVPEFPLGIGLLMSLVALIPVIYVWRTKPKKKVE
jgi:hypothetical protein